MLKMLRLGNDDFQCSHDQEAEARDVIYAGRWSVPPIPDVRQVHHVLDLEPSEGEFACWAWMRFGGPWIDCLCDPEAAMPVSLRRNLPPSARIIDAVPERPLYDAIHAGAKVELGLRILQCHPVVWYAAEWDTDAERLDITESARRRGMRLFKCELRDADVGRGLWLRSAAKWANGEYRLPAS